MTTGYAISFVSAEFMADSGSAGRAALRGVLRRMIDRDIAHGVPFRFLAFRIDPLERHQDLSAPAKPNPWTHVVKATAAIGEDDERWTDVPVVRGTAILPDGRVVETSAQIVRVPKPWPVEWLSGVAPRG